MKSSYEYLRDVLTVDGNRGTCRQTDGDSKAMRVVIYEYRKSIKMASTLSLRYSGIYVGR